MDNTLSFFFEGEGERKEEEPVWYFTKNETCLGPLKASEIYQKLKSAEISMADFLWKSGQKDWQRLYEIKEFSKILPNKPPKSLIPAKKTTLAPPPFVSNPEWFLYFNDSQFGPYGHSEVQRLLFVQKINPRVHAWKDGMKDWVRLEEVKIFKEACKKFVPPKAGAPDPALTKRIVPARERTYTRTIELRTAPRRPLVARILVANGQDVSVGMCRDLSVGGMQVLTNKIPGSIGDRVKINVSPGGQADSKGKLQAFVAEGVIVRIMSDGMGYSFRFDRLDEKAKAAIEGYLTA